MDKNIVAEIINKLQKDTKINFKKEQGTATKYANRIEDIWITVYDGSFGNVLGAQVWVGNKMFFPKTIPGADSKEWYEHDDYMELITAVIN